MKTINNQEKLSITFFFMLLIVLPLILTSNKEEKMILSKAEETPSATSSATIFPTIFVPTPSLYPTVSVEPTVSFVSPAQVYYPTVTQPPIQPSVLPTRIPSVFPPSINPTSSIQPTGAVFPTTPPEKEPAIKTTLLLSPLLSEQTQVFFDNFVTLLNDIFGVYVSSPKKTSAPINTSGSVMEAVINPTFNSNEYMRIQFLERDVVGGTLLQWIDKLFKKERARVVTYEMIMNPEGFVHTDQVILSMRVSRQAFDVDEPTERKQTITNANIDERIYFDRFGFFEHAYEARDAYPTHYNRIHTITITSISGGTTKKETPLTLDQWDDLGLGELRDEQGLSMTSSIRAQSSIIKNKYGNFNPESITLSMNGIYDIIQWLNSQSESPYAHITRDQLVHLLAKDDTLTVRIE